ncbi:MAG TPA: hypothetical protein VLA66_11125 [Thermoanaerobaculia bacterium]|nr:hypothetical protein [Thermoanaerobaculia bacterium]
MLASGTWSLATVLLLAAAAGPCARNDANAPSSTGGTTAEEATIEAEPEPEDGGFVLAVGEQARAGDGPLLVRFVRVVEDSRCPTGVTCVWAGRAVVEVAASLEDREVPERNLELEVGAAPAELYGWRLAAARLDPHPRAEERTATEDYRLELAVEPAAPG